MEQKTLAERLKWLRSQRGMTQRELSEQTGISIPQIVRYEAGRAEPRLRSIMRLAHVLGVDPVDLAPEMMAKTEEYDLSLPVELHTQLVQAAEERNCSIEELILEIVQDARRRLERDPEAKKAFEKRLEETRNGQKTE